MNEALMSINSTVLADISTLSLCHYLVLAVILFIIGICIVISGNNLIKTLIGIEFMLNAVCLNFAASNAYMNFTAPVGQAITLIIIAIGAINIAAGFALVLAVYFKLKNINTEKLDSLKSPDCPQNEALSRSEDF